MRVQANFLLNDATGLTAKRAGTLNRGGSLLLVLRLFSSRSFVIPLVKAHMTITGTPNWALTVKSTVPTPCTPPFPEILSNRVPGVSRPAARELIRFPRECLSGGRLCTFVRGSHDCPRCDLRLGDGACCSQRSRLSLQLRRRGVIYCIVRYSTRTAELQKLQV